MSTPAAREPVRRHRPDCEATASDGGATTAAGPCERRRGRRRGLHQHVHQLHGGNRDRRDEPIAAPRHGFDESRVVGGVVERLAELADGAVQPDLEFDERVRGPEHASQFFAGDHFTGTAQQLLQDLEGLIGQPDLQAMATQLAGVGVELEHAEAEDMRPAWERSFFPGVVGV